MAMTKFEDQHGEEWKLDFTLAEIDEIRDETGIDLLAMDVEYKDADWEKWKEQDSTTASTLLVRLMVDDRLRGQVIWAACKAQCEERGIKDPRDFARRLRGESYGAATKAFWEELRNFFQYSQRKYLATAIDKTIEMMGVASRIANRRMDGLSPERIAEGIFTDLPAS